MMEDFKGFTETVSDLNKYYEGTVSAVKIAYSSLGEFNSSIEIVNKSISEYNGKNPEEVIEFFKKSLIKASGKG